MANARSGHYCTLFDKNYFLKGLALYRSLLQHETDFVLHILCMDDVTHDLLQRMALSSVQLIRRVDFEDAELLAVKSERSAAEYCWTCTSSLISYVLHTRPEISLITYLDADLYFFAPSDAVFREFGQRSVLIIGHKFSPALRHLEENGRFNVGWVSFRRDANGLAALAWWRARCIEWCFARVEDGRMGDQKYLDSFGALFGGTHELAHKGANVAPWNFAGYHISAPEGRILIDDTPLIFYHFHSFRARIDGGFDPIGDAYLTEAPLPEVIYAQYQTAIATALEYVRTYDANFAFGLDPLSAVQSETVSETYSGAENSPRIWYRRIARAVIPDAIRSRIVRAVLPRLQ
jgi:hypothetical protein